MNPADTLKELDLELATLARSEAALRLRLGQALEVLSRGGYAELGFSSLAAYALERCERSVRWAEGARCLAQRLEALPELRAALADGSLSWSMAELVARVASPPDEREWLAAGRQRTVRQMREIVGRTLRARGSSDGVGVRLGLQGEGDVVGSGSSGRGPEFSRDTLDAEGNSHVDAEPGDEAPSSDDSCGTLAREEEELCTLTCTVDQEEAWLFEATRRLLEHLGEPNSASQIDALLAEGHGSLLAALPPGALDAENGASLGLEARRRWLEELARWRAAAEVSSEARVQRLRQSDQDRTPAPGGIARDAAMGAPTLTGMSARQVDGLVRSLESMLAQHELELSRRLLKLHRSGSVEALGYANEGQYARERLGISRSALLSRRALATRLEALPRIAEALGSGGIGVEAALQAVRVATPETELAWVARAKQRTVKHLKEEVAAARVAMRVSGEPDCPPPTEAELESFRSLERAVLSGEVCRPPGQRDPEAGSTSSGVDGDGVADSMGADDATEGGRSGEAGGSRDTEGAGSQATRGAWAVALGSLTGWLEQGVQMSAGVKLHGRYSSAGRVMLRLRVLRETYESWRDLEARARRWLPSGMSWLKFLCLSVWKAWGHVLDRDMAYRAVYVRDRFRCTSPVCQRTDVTPHHIVFRSAGGGDEAFNVTALCLVCHLFGVHAGRIRVTGSAPALRWELGAIGDPCVVVHGRERVTA